MKIISPKDFIAMPWKNGGGVTREIARHEEHGKLVWRFSIADVTSDGPFSRFEGLARILTVIEGAGLKLSTPQGALLALPMEPLAFSGDLPVSSTRLNGNVRDFNVIYDPALVSAEMSMERGIVALEADAGFLVHTALLTGESKVRGQLVAAGSFILLEEGAVRLESTAPMLCVTLRTIKAT